MDRLIALCVDLLITLCVIYVVAVALVLSRQIANKIVGRPDWGRMGRRRRVIARVGLGMVALIPLALLLGRLWLGTPFLIGPYNVQGSSVPDARGVYDQPCMAQQNVLILTMHGTDVVQDTVKVDVALCVGDQTLRQLTLLATGMQPFANAVFSCGNVIALNISRGVLQAAFKVLYEGYFPAQIWIGQVSISQFITSSVNKSCPYQLFREPIYVGTLALALNGNADNYPLDGYWAKGDWSLLIPDGMYLSGSPDSSLPDIPVVTRILTSPGGAELNWRSDAESTPSTPANGGTLEATRSFPNQLFIVVLILLPLLLFIGALWTLRSRAAHDSKEDDRLPPEVLIGVGTFLLAVFPIRTVLVPPDISRLTIVDYVLGSEMAVMVAATLWIALAVRERSAAEGTSRPSTPESSDP
jgi:hypothetical protein